MNTSYKILVYRHREQRFVEEYPGYIDKESDTFSCTCDTYSNQKNLIIFSDASTIFDLETSVFGAAVVFLVQMKLVIFAK